MFTFIPADHSCWQQSFDSSTPKEPVYNASLNEALSIDGLRGLD